MPNVVNRCKPNPLLKMEKENENKDLRRKLKSLHKVTFRSLSERSPGLNNQRETVWDRLSRVKKSASNDANILLTGTRSRILIQAKSSHHRLQTAARTTGQRTHNNNKKPLTPNTNHNKQQSKGVIEKKSSAQQKVKGKTSTFIPRLDTTESVFNCQSVKSVKEIMTARSICNSKTSSEDNSLLKKATSRSENVSPIIPTLEMVSYDTDEYDDEGGEDVGSQDSFDEYVVAPLIPVPTTESLNMSATIETNFRRLLDCRKKHMPPEEISMIKNVVKTDERHRQLQPNESLLFKEILKTQLKEIIRQETVVKSALHNLNEYSDPDVPSTIAIHKPYVPPEAVNRKPQVDVIFKNVPTLEKEIIILKALGEKLEATLKRTVSQNDLKLMELNKLAMPLQNRWLAVFAVNLQYAMHELVPKGVRRCMGVVQEFRMEYKTIVELKEQANRHFYLPSNKDHTELKRTSFKRLKENPDLLMRYLKPKNTLVPFNVLEQDPCFFNSFIYSPCVLDGLESAISLAKESSLASSGSKIAVVKDAGDSARSAQSARVPYTNYVKEPLQIEEIQCTLNEALFYENAIEKDMENEAIEMENEATEKEENQATESGNQPIESEENQSVNLALKNKKSTNFCEAPVRGRRRRRIRRHHTPLPPDIDTDPKLNLFKTILVGSAQISVFLLLIMAITYPDIRC